MDLAKKNFKGHQYSGWRKWGSKFGCSTADGGEEWIWIYGSWGLTLGRKAIMPWFGTLSPGCSFTKNAVFGGMWAFWGHFRTYWDWSPMWHISVVKISCRIDTRVHSFTSHPRWRSNFGGLQHDWEGKALGREKMIQGGVRAYRSTGEGKKSTTI